MTATTSLPPAEPSCCHCGHEGDGYRAEPRGYVSWFDFAAAMTRAGYAQDKCPGCGRFSVWVLRPSYESEEGSSSL